jgi:hypothetical protein
MFVAEGAALLLLCVAGQLRDADCEWLDVNHPTSGLGAVLTCVKVCHRQNSYPMSMMSQIVSWHMQLAIGRNL